MIIRIVSILLIFSSVAFSQELKTKPNWFNLDHQRDGIRGMSVEKAYHELLTGKPSQPVIVGVIDSGVDIEHEDLKDVIWVNTGEIPDNGIDDDKNGFVDDVYGWDFIGGANGQDVAQEQLESVRLLIKYDNLFGANPKKKVLRKYKNEYNEYQKIKLEIEEKKAEAAQYLPMYQSLKETFSQAEDVLKEELTFENLTREMVEGIVDSEVDLKVRQAKRYWLYMTEQGVTVKAIEEGIEHFNSQLNFNYNKDFRPRDIVGDNPEKLEYGKYGNNEVKGPRALHGTHVSGIIAANRKNNLGIKGVGDNVKIMVVRTVPDGDERDKDVANAIRYAADNGAQIINMSFGKPYSPEKAWVDDAVKYALSKGVLFIAAAGNESENIDEKPHYPTKNYLKGGQAENWITVGALSHEPGSDMIATFSNYGKKNVDVFAPGVDLYSTVPGSEYQEQSGTSMASPAVAGVAALIKSYYPELSAAQIKEAILKSATVITEQVKQPGGEELVPFSSLCVTGGVVNAYDALVLAAQMAKAQ
jgi:subtilisin family serine protease